MLYRNLFGLENEVALVTGASGDLGSSISEALASYGADLVLTGRDEARLNRTRSLVRRLGRNALVAKADATSLSEIKRVLKRAVKEFDRIDILVTCHGTNFRMATENYPLRQWQRIMDINLKGTFLWNQAVGRQMIKQRSGTIINISSTAATTGYPFGYSAYSPSKGGVEALTRTLAVEWAKYNVRVNAVAPFMVVGRFVEPVMKNRKLKESLLSLIPLGRFGFPEDIVGSVVFLASKASSWITGQTICVDGGRTA